MLAGLALASNLLKLGSSSVFTETIVFFLILAVHHIKIPGTDAAMIKFKNNTILERGILCPQETNDQSHSAVGSMMENAKECPWDVSMGGFLEEEVAKPGSKAHG